MDGLGLPSATMIRPRLQWVPSVPVRSPPCDVRRKPPPSWVDDVRLELGVLGRHCLPTRDDPPPETNSSHLKMFWVSAHFQAELLVLGRVHHFHQFWLFTCQILTYPVQTPFQNGGTFHLSPPNGISAHPVLPRAMHGTMECQVCKMKQKLGVEQDLHVSILDCNGTPAHHNFNMDLLQLCNSWISTWFCAVWLQDVTSRFEILHWHFNWPAVQTCYASSFHEGNAARISNILSDLVPHLCTCLVTFAPRYFDQFAIQTSYTSQF